MSKYRQTIVDVSVLIVAGAAILITIGYWTLFVRTHYSDQSWSGRITGSSYIGDAWLGGRFLDYPATRIKRVNKQIGLTNDPHVFFFVELDNTAQPPSILNDSRFKKVSISQDAKQEPSAEHWPKWFPPFHTSTGYIDDKSGRRNRVFLNSHNKVFLLVSD
jgi:hypothetical protein